MTEKPILFSSPMVRAILAGHKTQTRRVLTPQPVRGETLWRWGDGYIWDEKQVLLEGVDLATQCPYGRPGDRLWCRETWRTYQSLDRVKPRNIRAGAGVEYKACGNTIGCEALNGMGKWRPSIFMPRWASRLTLGLSSVRVERLQDITESDANAEGCPSHLSVQTLTPARLDYAMLWDSLNAKRGLGWQTNVWVWVLCFKPVRW